jgi:hypothetical protein
MAGGKVSLTCKGRILYKSGRGFSLAAQELLGFLPHLYVRWFFPSRCFVSYVLICRRSGNLITGAYVGVHAQIEFLIVRNWARRYLSREVRL